MPRDRTAGGPVIGIVAGEASGDLLGSQLMHALRGLVPDARFIGIGGPRMEAAGMEALCSMEQLAVRGYLEVIKHLPAIIGIRRRLRKRLLADPPALFIGVDAPDFNLGLERALKRRGIPTVHYASPSLWIWRGERIHRIKRAVSKMLALFPFEPPIYERAGIPVAYVGHPLADVLAAVPGKREAREQLRLPAGATVVALLPGSRRGELEQMAQLFIDTARLVRQRRPQARFLVPLVTRETRLLFEEAVYRRDAADLEFNILFGHAHEAMAAADAVLVASGTATLEAALLGRPMVITYKVARAAARMLRMLRKAYLPYFGLPNILAGEFVVPELIQEDATPENLAQALANLLDDEVVKGRIERRFGNMADALGKGAAQRAARELLPYLRAYG